MKACRTGRVRSVAVAGTLAGCGMASGPPAIPGEETAGSRTPAELPVVVHLAVGDGPGAGNSAEGESIAAATARVMERLKAAMPAEEFARVRSFGFFPAISLAADGALLLLLLDVSEVASVERDCELAPVRGLAPLVDPLADVRFE